MINTILITPTVSRVSTDLYTQPNGWTLIKASYPLSLFHQHHSLVVDSQATSGYNHLTIGGHDCAVGIDFEWDPNKATRNLQKHGVSFEEAATVFRDDLSISVPDPDHSLEEERFITVGVSSQNRLLMVAHTEIGDSIRIISARELTPSERTQHVEADWDG